MDLPSSTNIDAMSPPKPKPKFITANWAPKYRVTNSEETISIASALWLGHIADCPNEIIVKTIIAVGKFSIFAIPAYPMAETISDPNKTGFGPQWSIKVPCKGEKRSDANIP